MDRSDEHPVYIAENTYVVVLSVTKLSILFFYLRIFKYRYWFCVQVWATIAMVCVSTAIILVMTIFSCHPIDYFWDRDIKGGTCLDVNALAYANSASGRHHHSLATSRGIEIKYEPAEEGRHLTDVCVGGFVGQIFPQCLC